MTRIGLYYARSVWALFWFLLFLVSAGATAAVATRAYTVDGVAGIALAVLVCLAASIELLRSILILKTDRDALVRMRLRAASGRTRGNDYATNDWHADGDKPGYAYRDHAWRAASKEETASAVAARNPSPKEQVGVADIELFWFDSSYYRKISAEPAWKHLFSLVLREFPIKSIEAELSEARFKERARRAISLVLAKSVPLDMGGLESEMSSAGSAEGIFVPPLVLVAGELTLPFDDVEALKATVAVTTPFARRGSRLEKAIEEARRLLESPWLRSGSSEVASELAERLMAVAKGDMDSTLGGPLERQVDRTLLQARAYQRRVVLGKECVLGLLALPGARDEIRLYLPTEAVQELPALLRLSVRVVAECRRRLEEDDPRAMALRAVGIGLLPSPPSTPLR